MRVLVEHMVDHDYVSAASPTVPVFSSDLDALLDSLA
jgi:hypothetical protein